MHDPTREEMLDVIKTYFGHSADVSQFDIEEAIYWFAADYHGGQWTNLYSALSVSPYKPGPLRNGPEQDELYQALVEEFA